MHRKGADIHRENLPWSRTVIQTAEKGASARQAAKRGGGEKAAITHWACWLEREPVATPQEKHQEHRSRVNVCPLPSGAILKTGFPTPSLRSLILKICYRVSSTGMMKAPSPSLSGKRTLS